MMGLHRLVLLRAVGRDLVNPSPHEPFHVKVRVSDRRDRFLTDLQVVKFLLFLKFTHVTRLHFEI